MPKNCVCSCIECVGPRCCGDDACTLATFGNKALPEPFCAEPCKHVSCNTVRGKKGKEAT